MLRPDSVAASRPRDHTGFQGMLTAGLPGPNQKLAHRQEAYVTGFVAVVILKSGALRSAPAGPRSHREAAPVPNAGSIRWALADRKHIRVSQKSQRWPPE